MALFKEIPCSVCGGKTSMLTRARLADKQYVCSQCLKKVPGYIKHELSKYSVEDFQEMKKFLEYSRTELKKSFTSTHFFTTLFLDAKHGLFYVDDLGSRLYLPLQDLEEFELEYEPEEAKEGLLSDSVKGSVHLKMKMGNPAFSRDEIIATGVKANAVKKGIINRRLEYDLPKGMGEFLQAFNEAWVASREAMYARLTQEALQLQAMLENNQ